MKNTNRYSLLTACLLVLNLLFSPIVNAQSPIAGSLIQNQASATYKDAAGIEQTTTSNVVATLIQQVGAMELVQNQTRFGAAGNTVYLPHVLTNTGNGMDHFDLNATDNNGGQYNFDSLIIYADANQDGIPDNSIPISSTGSLSAAEKFYFVIAVMIPSDAQDTQQEGLTVTGTSTFDSSKQKTNTDIITVSDKAVIEVTKSISANSGISPSGAYTVTLSYKNTGALDATDVTLIDVLPAGMSYHSDGINNHARMSVDSFISLQLTDEDEDNQVGIRYCAYDPSCSHAPFVNNQVTAVIDTVAAGSYGKLSFQVMIDTDLPADTLLNIATFKYNNGSLDVPMVNTNQVPFEVVEQPRVVANGSINNNTDGTGESVTVTTASQGATASFDNIIWNTGNSVDTFDISIDELSSTFPSETVFQLFKSDGFTPLLDTNANGVVDTGSVDVGSYYKVVLKAVLPVEASGDNNGNGFDITKTATSSLDPSISNPVTDHLDRIASDAVDLTNNAELGQANVLGAGAGPEANPLTTETVAPGEKATFRLFINNISDNPRSYQLQFSNSNFAPGVINPNWKVAFYKDGGGSCATLGAVTRSTGVIAANSSGSLCAVVTVPADAVADGVIHPVYFKVYNKITGVSDIKLDAVVISKQAALGIEPNQTGQVQPGNSIVYSHRISNNGNMPLECINVMLSDNQLGWTSIIYKDVNKNGQLDGTDVPLSNQLLAVGQSFPILLKLFAPANAPMGTQNITNLVVTGHQDDGDANSTTCTGNQLTDSAEDATTVNASEVSILKEQAPDNNCDGIADDSYVTSSFQIDAGKCVMYRLTATNAGAIAVNNVRINDAAPAYTQFYNVVGLPNVTQGNIIGGVTGQDDEVTGGSVNGASITVQPGGKMVLNFGVKLD